MTDKRKQRIRKLADELGIGHRAAANIITKRATCQRAGHVANREPHGSACTDCGGSLAPSADTSRKDTGK
jgi:hypothetical protein